MKPSASRARLTALVVAFLFACGIPAIAIAAFVLNDVVVSDLGDDLRDPEFDKTPATMRMAWQEPTGDLWVADMDAETGTWLPTDGRQILVDIDLLPIRYTRQGAEWAYDDADNRLVYTRRVGSTGFQLMQAWRDTLGAYVTEPLIGGEDRALAEASRTPGDPAPRALYTMLVNGEPRFGWRELDDPATDRLLPDSIQNPKWVADRRALVATQPVNGIDQVVLYDIDQDTTTQLTFTASMKRWPLMWRDPASGQFILMAVIDDTQIGVWQQNRAGSWKLTDRYRPRTRLPYLFKPDYFISGGASYVAYLATTQVYGREQGFIGTGEVWVTRLTGTGPFRHRRINDPAVTVIKDVENLATGSGIYAYYSEALEDGRALIHRAATGLQ